MVSNADCYKKNSTSFMTHVDPGIIYSYANYFLYVFLMHYTYNN